MNYEESLEYIHSINWCFCKPGLERIGELCKKLGYPERELKFVHIAGTNGKGSTASMLESVLRAAGYKTGLYTSPYIKVFNERMKINGENISNAELAEITSDIRPIADSMIDKPTEFELITAVAFEYFRRNKCDIVLLEAGMGGRLDSTNIIENSLLSVITGIALDHTAFLGDTVEKIAAEKAGIIKNGCPVLFGGTDDSADKIIRAHAAELGSEYSRVDYSKLYVREMTLDRTQFDFGEHTDMHISLLGEYQPRNAAIVLSASDILRREGFCISEDAIRIGLGTARWQARFEIICRDPLVIFDGAHNVEGITAAVSSIKRYFGNEKVYVLTGVLKDKDYRTMASDVAKVASRAFTITPENSRALSSREYARVLCENGVSSEAFDSVEDALWCAVNAARESNTALVCLGSLYTYSSIIGHFDT